MAYNLNLVFGLIFEHASVCSFLFDAECAEYKYYQYRVEQEEAALAPEAAASQTPHTGQWSMNSLSMLGYKR